MRTLLATLILGITAIMTYCSLASAAVPAHAQSPQFADGKFRNAIKMREYSFGEMVGLWWNAMINKPAGTMPAQAIPVRALSRADLLAAPDKSLFRLGHSTILFKLGGAFYLTDPVFSERASPVGWAGPKRFHAPPVSIEELPPIQAVILSHDHYDHLDHAAIMQLAAKTSHFLAPLGVGDRLVQWGVEASKVRQFDWWEEATIDGVRFIATPSQHFSGRTLGDRDTTLWASWVILHDELRLFFSGDSGYFKGFKEIGERFGPFDVAMVETGAYDKQWPEVHMQPEETLQAFLDLKGKWLLPVHNGTFDLALHRWQDPLERISALASTSDVKLTTPEMGEPLDLTAPHAGKPWWRELE
ncbi:MBL fold metallo-hydrolase [Massilia sp. LjRoot122]|uniref:MBL fold metallo-hydrolase n=1 Tax=Massilia sp. LjRoot122 TaxID=3342257 RepID=UPI003ECFA35D